MSLDVSPPEPPELSTVDPDEYEDAEVAGDEYRRDELAEFLATGAWAEAFERWAADSRLDADDWAVVRELKLLAEFDFFWDDFAGRVGYHAPGIPEDWQVKEYHSALDSWERVSSINAGLTELGQEVCDILLEEYIDWEAEFEAPDDLPEF